MIDVVRCKCGHYAKMSHIKRETSNGLKDAYSINCKVCKRHTQYYSSKNLVRKVWLALIK